MRKIARKSIGGVWQYALEFLVILVGITVSFYWDQAKSDAADYALMMQSLRRISANLDADAVEFQENMQVHFMASASCRWLFERRHRLEDAHPDSVGFHACLCLDGQTLFVDNKEEYLGLRNSGTLQLIEDSALVRLLQEKYANHNYLSRLDDYNNQLSSDFRKLLFTHFEVVEPDPFDLDFVTFRTWKGRPLSREFLEFTYDLSEWHMGYYWALEEQLTFDSLLQKKFNVLVPM